jgi:hypothetical protein
MWPEPIITFEHSDKVTRQSGSSSSTVAHDTIGDQLSDSGNSASYGHEPGKIAL